MERGARRLLVRGARAAASTCPASAAAPGARSARTRALLRRTSQQLPSGSVSAARRWPKTAHMAARRPSQPPARTSRRLATATSTRRSIGSRPSLRNASKSLRRSLRARAVRVWGMRARSRREARGVRAARRGKARARARAQRARSPRRAPLSGTARRLCERRARPDQLLEREEEVLGSSARRPGQQQDEAVQRANAAPVQQAAQLGDAPGGRGGVQRRGRRWSARAAGRRRAARPPRQWRGRGGDALPECSTVASELGGGARRGAAELADGGAAALGVRGGRGGRDGDLEREREADEVVRAVGREADADDVDGADGARAGRRAGGGARRAARHRGVDWRCLEGECPRCG